MPTDSGGDQERITSSFILGAKKPCFTLLRIILCWNSVFQQVSQVCLRSAGAPNGSRRLVNTRKARVSLMHLPTPLQRLHLPFIGYRWLLGTMTTMPRDGGGTCWEYSTAQCTLTRAFWEGSSRTASTCWAVGESPLSAQQRPPARCFRHPLFRGGLHPCRTGLRLGLLHECGGGDF
jgi:hypothetical protein